jgi:hypothetical protein
MNNPDGLKSFTLETSLPVGDSQYTQMGSATEMREVRLREGPVVTCIVLTVFNRDRVLCSRIFLLGAVREQAVIFSILHEIVNGRFVSIVEITLFDISF